MFLLKRVGYSGSEGAGEKGFILERNIFLNYSLREKSKERLSEMTSNEDSCSTLAWDNCVWVLTATIQLLDQFPLSFQSSSVTIFFPIILIDACLAWKMLELSRKGRKDSSSCWHVLEKHLCHFRLQIWWPFVICGGSAPWPLRILKPTDAEIHGGPGLQCHNNLSWSWARLSRSQTGLPASSETTRNHFRFALVISGRIWECSEAREDCAWPHPCLRWTSGHYWRSLVWTGNSFWSCPGGRLSCVLGVCGYSNLWMQDLWVKGSV